MEVLLTPLDIPITQQRSYNVGLTPKLAQPLRDHSVGSRAGSRKGGLPNGSIGYPFGMLVYGLYHMFHSFRAPSAECDACPTEEFTESKESKQFTTAK